jgi:phosphopantothenoylcysteine synthetase/decarboxylase
MSQLKNKKILITAGPTWIPIDKVRVITNIFKGTLGLLIAKNAAKRKADVTLLLGPGQICLPQRASSHLKIIKFKFFKELHDLMEKEISSKKYDILIHSSAIGDYEPDKFYCGKIKSGKKDFALKFKPTIKIVDMVKKWDPNIFLVKFKMEADLQKEELIKKAYKSMLDSNADLMVANSLKDMADKKHKAFIIDKKKNIIQEETKETVAKKILDIIAELT